MFAWPSHIRAENLSVVLYVFYRIFMNRQYSCMSMIAVVFALVNFSASEVFKCFNDKSLVRKCSTNAVYFSNSVAHFM